MTNDKNSKFSTLAEIAKDNRVNLNKSNLTYYVRIGLIAPDYLASNVQIFEKEKTIKKIQRIKTLSIAGHNLPQIKKILDNDKT